ncbi:ABC transporter permease [Synechococcus sp. CCY9202]|uniref:ABC transporter permease n=1 Tax=Synechococcus sp. CCY9202 TaxID=174698 RepID=UPI002B200D5D|nr:ABC-2 family transporter protein [Synechococcus sp. CCY9202]MEA5423942.1 ABC-2 family transporter protein [Synechococcus sp. CCY9202]
MSKKLQRGLRLVRVLLSSQYAYMLEYRAEIALWALSGVLPFIMLGLWSGASGINGNAPTAELPSLGLDPIALARYFLAVFIVRQFTLVWVIYTFEEDHLQGRLSGYLLQPLAPVWRYVSAHIAEQATRLPFVIALAALFFLLYPAAFWLPSPAALLLAVMAMQLAFALRFLIQFALTTVCFWSERASALERLLFIPYLYLSGLIAPLQLYPEPVRRLALWTPFPYMIAIPAQLLAGDAVDVVASFAVVGGWIAILLPLTLFLWRRGLRKYGAMGA